ncbi:isochorismatase family protein [Undibacterium flavidum]|uniref:Isochorismatase family protein n=1 Tax=Undibacterium flavidum TaxID=2762297 RepID=A0ABR6Y5Z4_9BURK|nr:isochorismatase family protein [Undibacterium flavidum]MBC3872045.1 isochorismatase family protein [Undibacterium flavidum]
MQTLLIIDMQNAWLDEHPRFDIEAIKQRINLTSKQFRQSGWPVIFVQHEDENVRVGSKEWDIHQDLIRVDGDHYIHKTACDAFANTNLKVLLRELGSSSLTLCGLATEFCVDTTIRASLSQGYDVIALSDAHTTANRPHLTAETIIQHHNWMWTNIAAPQHRKIQVISTHDYLKNI